MISKESHTQSWEQDKNTDFFGVDHHKYSFLGWTIPSNVRSCYAFNAAQDKATQQKKS